MLKGTKHTNQSKEKISKSSKLRWDNGLGSGFKKGHPPSYTNSQEKHCGWKGNMVGYDALHDWIQKYGKLSYGKKLNVCEHCGVIKTGKYQIDWANKSHEYKREFSDWLRLCRRCHKKYDSMIHTEDLP